MKFSVELQYAENYILITADFSCQKAPKTHFLTQQYTARQQIKKKKKSVSN